MAVHLVLDFGDDGRLQYCERKKWELELRGRAVGEIFISEYSCIQGIRKAARAHGMEISWSRSQPNLRKCCAHLPPYLTLVYVWRTR